MQNDLSQKFFGILVEHNDEMVMSGMFLVNLANELAEAAQQSVQADVLPCGHKIWGYNRVGEPFCEECHPATRR